MGDPVPSSAISDATVGGLSVIVITGGSTGQVLTLQSDGTYAPATASGGSPGGSSGQVQWNNGGAFAGAAAVVYATTEVHVIIAAQGATTVPLCIRGAASQTASHTEIQRSDGGVLIALEGATSQTQGRIRIRAFNPGFNNNDALNLLAFGNDAYIDQASNGSLFFRVAGGARTNLTLFNSTSRGASFGQPVEIASSSDAAAANSTLYFSTTQSKLVWKDASGTVNVLY